MSLSQLFILILVFVKTHVMFSCQILMAKNKTQSFHSLHIIFYCFLVFCCVEMESFDNFLTMFIGSLMHPSGKAL